MGRPEAGGCRLQEMQNEATGGRLEAGDCRPQGIQNEPTGEELPQVLGVEPELCENVPIPLT